MEQTMSPPERLAAERLPPDVAGRWRALLRPAVRLTRPDDRRAPLAGPPVGHLGGRPELPDDVPWPVWEGNGPLTFVASLSLSALAGLPGAELDIPLPKDGTLLFFVSYGPGQGDGVPGIGPDGQQGARVVYVPEGTPVAERRVPGGLEEPYRRVRLSAEPETTWPGHEDFWRGDLVGASPGDDLPEWLDEFDDALDDLVPKVWHRIGGHPTCIQGGVDLDGLGEDEDLDDWVLLAQIDSDRRAGMDWVHQGTLYWLITRADLAARNFAAARFTWQFL
ncbi:YwqG family protein [Streptomyces monomycini]|uniref:YwqG family protein n=1 Tax=Streptomyces monomycini TaxID=371720 RepID=UPI0004AAD328|nr:YwqG family protein [Streptomyces monomycini]